MKEEDISLENQRTIYRYIVENPGSHLRKISRDLGMHLSTLRYHLNFLEKKRLIIGKEENNTRIFFAVGKLKPEDKNIASLLQQRRFRDIILLLVINPGLTHSDISKRLALKPSTLSKYCRILEERGVIYSEKDGREKHYYVVDEKKVMELLLTYKKSFWDSFVDNVLEIYFER